MVDLLVYPHVVECRCSHVVNILTVVTHCGSSSNYKGHCSEVRVLVTV